MLQMLLLVLVASAFNAITVHRYVCSTTICAIAYTLPALVVTSTAVSAVVSIDSSAAAWDS
jgi:hypothetical protein